MTREMRKRNFCLMGLSFIKKERQREREGEGDRERWWIPKQKPILGTGGKAMSDFDFHIFVHISDFSLCIYLNIF